MARYNEEPDVLRCLRLIEGKLNWGPSQGWVNYDYEKLSDIIHQDTGVRLSTTTLKRIWGKLKYDSAPTVTTLNAMARYAGYEDWRTFTVNGPITPAPASTDPVPQRAPLRLNKKLSTRYLWFLLVIPLFLLGYALIPEKKVRNRDQFSFEPSKVVTEGVPNSVVFHYDAAAAGSDSVFIVQTWDIRRKKQVPANKSDHSAIYYYPGYFRTKLIVGEEVVQARDLWITSDGWLSLVENEPVPLYFKKEETARDNGVEIDSALLAKYNLSLYPEPPKTRFFNQRDFGDLMNDNFVFETQISNQLDGGINACQFVEVLIQCKNDIIIIGLSKQTCVGDLSLYFCGTGVSSKEADLSGFGADLNEWTKLRVETVDKLASFFVNDKKVYELSFPHDPTGIVGVQYRFNGVGAVKDTYFERGKKKITL